jgi:hypothetical protein
MSRPQSHSEATMESPRSQKIEMKIEVVVIPVSNVDPAKHFYDVLGWRLDLGIATGEDYRAVQFTPPSSSCSIMFGRGITTAAPRVGTKLPSHCVRHRRGAHSATQVRYKSRRTIPRPRRPIPRKNVTCDNSWQAAALSDGYGVILLYEPARPSVAPARPIDVRESLKAFPIPNYGSGDRSGRAIDPRSSL